MTRPRIEPQSPEPLASTLLIWLMGQYATIYGMLTFQNCQDVCDFYCKKNKKNEPYLVES